MWSPRTGSRYHVASRFEHGMRTKWRSFQLFIAITTMHIKGVNLFLLHKVVYIRVLLEKYSIFFFAKTWRISMKRS